MITGLTEGMIASIAAGLVIYQLRIGTDTEKQQSNIDEARFILQYNQAFIQDSNMSEIERLLEDAMLGKATLPIIQDDNRQKLINYLVYLESLAPLVLANVLTLDHVDDLFAYRFFLAVNNSEVQEEQLFAFPDYYRGCFKLYEAWKKFCESKGLPILLKETSLDKWPHYRAYCNTEVIVRPMKDSDCKKDIASLIYQTDPYIYPALLGTAMDAKRMIPPMMADDCVFNCSNIRVAELNRKIVGVAVVLNSQPRKRIDRSLVNGKSGKDVCERYFDKLNQYLDSEETTYILCLCVDPKARGKRVGEILLKSVIATSAHQKQKLHVLADNTIAINLYKKHGFVSADERPSKGYAYRGEAPDCFEMTRSKA